MIILETGGILLDRHERYEGHLPEALPRHFVCAQCGANTVTFYRKTGVLVACGHENTHRGIVTPQEFKKLYPEPEVSQETLNAIRSDPILGPALKEIRRALIQDLYGED